MSYKRRSLDPRQMTSRFASVCHTCKKPIYKGEQIIYWPNGNHTDHLACGEADYRSSLASFEDEDWYNSRYPSYKIIKAVPGNRDGYFLIVHGLIQAKGHRTYYSKFSAKVTS